MTIDLTSPEMTPEKAEAAEAEDKEVEEARRRGEPPLDWREDLDEDNEDIDEDADEGEA